MGYYQLVMPRESAWEILNEIGEISSVHFINQEPENPMFNRPFTNSIKKGEEISGKIQFIEGQMKKFNEKIVKCPDVREFLKNFKKKMEKREKAQSLFLQEIEEEVESYSSQINIQIKNYENLLDKMKSLLEMKAVYEKLEQVYGNSLFIG